MYIDEVRPLGKGRVLVCSDGEPVFALHIKEANTLGIVPDRELSDDEYRYILDNILTKRAKLRAMKILESRDKTEKELRVLLDRDYYPEEITEAAIDYVKSYGYIDDERYARSYIGYRIEKKSRKQLELELIQRGIDQSVIYEAFAELMPEDESGRIISLIEKRYKGHMPDCLPRQDDEKEWARLYRHLLGKGYSYSDIKKAISLN